MQNTSPFLAMQRLELQLKAVFSSLDVELLDLGPRKAVATMKRLTVDAKLDLRDYELSETREEQLRHADEARKRLAKIQASLLLTEDLFGPADVAQLTAELDQIREWIQ